MRVGLIRLSRHQALAPLPTRSPGGIDSLCSPCGQPTRCARGLSNGLSPVVEPRSGILIPPCSGDIKEKSPYFRTGSHLE